MNGATWKMTILVLIVSLAFLGGVEAQQQRHHRGSAPASQEQAPPETPEAPVQTPMMQQMQGMMQQMQGMMQQMHGSMQHMHGRMGRGGMMSRGMMRGAGGGMGHGMMMQRKLERLAQQLELTDDQKMQVQALLRTEAKETIRLQADIDTTTIDLHQLLDADPVDMARVKTTLQTIATKEADLRLAHITSMQDIRKLLTPEQQQKFRMSWAHMMGRGGMMKQGSMMGQEGMRMHGKRMGRGGMRGQGGMRNPCGMPSDQSKN